MSRAADERTHTLVVTKSAMENVVRVQCGDCQMVLSKVDEFHPPEFCLLVKSGFPPWPFVQKAAQRLPKRQSYEVQGIDYPLPSSNVKVVDSAPIQ